MNGNSSTRVYDDPTPLSPFFVAVVGAEMIMLAFGIIASVLSIREAFLQSVCSIVTFGCAQYGLWRVLCLDKKGLLIFFTALMLNVCAFFIDWTNGQESLLILYLIAIAFTFLSMLLKSNGLNAYQLLWGDYANHLKCRRPSLRSLFYNPFAVADSSRFFKFKNILLVLFAVFISILTPLLLTGHFNTLAQSITGQWYLHDSTRIVVTLIITAIDFAIAHLILRLTIFGRSKAFNMMTFALIFLWCILVGIIFIPD